MSFWQELKAQVSAGIKRFLIDRAPEDGPVRTTEPPRTAPQATPPAPTVRPTDLVTAVASALARRFEGLYLTPYLCPAGVPTVGYGATYYEDGTRVSLHDAPITKERAEALLAWMVKTVYLPAVLKLFPGVQDPYLLAALTDFAFNLGETNLRGSTLRRKVLANDMDAVPEEFRKWVMAGGRKLRGLVLRREAEITTWQDQGVAAATGKGLP